MQILDNVKLSVAALAAGLSLALSPASAVTVDLDGLGLNNADIIEAERPGFGSGGPVTLNWAPTGFAGQELLFWNGDYSGRAAAYCGTGTNCALDLYVDPGFTVTLDSFRLGGWPDTDRDVTWSVIDFSSSAIIASAVDAFVSGTAGLTITIGATSTAGFRILFGPDGNTGGINDIVYSFASPTAPVDPVDPVDPSVIPLPAGGWLLLAGLGGIAALRRSRKV